MGTLYPTHKPGLGLHYGKYTNGIPEAGVPASVVDADHLNLLTDNIEETIKTAGLDPSHATTDVNQLKKALLWAAGIWQSGTDYPEGATVLQDGTRYIAARTHTATGTNAPNQNGAPWESVDYRSFNKLYPVGSIYINYNNALNPADESLLGFGTWHPLPANYFLSQAGSDYVAGETVEDGLPEIEGSGVTHVQLLGANGTRRGSGALRHRGGGPNAWRVGYLTPGGSEGTLEFLASRSNPIYGGSPVVRPKTLGTRMWRRLA
ncbi:hypothetical protein P0082_00920 [Candidatus Haliotispira prima]|uniref:Chitin-binding type-3 domain-containing protein n=1 Tax=Candidatus Haliotispira prima TaxID=3034016 RepID=A0ABY8MJA2_9SPIO|nr:hypothetical protein P0082_00920 [Candidatus Haliotispira prima]